MKTKAAIETKLVSLESRFHNIIKKDPQDRTAQEYRHLKHLPGKLKMLMWVLDVK